MARHGFGSSVVLVLLLVTTFVQPWSTSPSIASTDIIATFQEKIGFSVWLVSTWCFGGLNISSTNNCWHSGDNELLSSLNKCCDSNSNELLTFIVAVRTMFFLSSRPISSLLIDCLSTRHQTRYFLCVSFARWRM